LVTEASGVANASGAEIDPAQILTVFASSPSAMRSSMQKDLAAGRKLEIDAIGGPIVRAGEAFKIDVSTTVEVIAAIRAKAAV
jgi:2-dehydropantoate 2-reductase